MSELIVSCGVCGQVLVTADKIGPAYEADEIANYQQTVSCSVDGQANIQVISQ